LPTQTEADNAFNATLAASGYSDACGGVVTAELVSAVVSGDKCAWSILYTFKVKDECGNYLNNQTYTRSGGDKTAPVLTGTIPAGGTGINACAAPVGPTEAQIAALYTDACGGAITVVKTGSPTGTSCGWTVTYHYTIKDECGNFATAVDITYSGSDQTPPTWVTAAGSLDRTVYCGQLSLLTSAQALAPSATDNCGGTVTYVKTSGVFVPGGANGAGTYTNTWIAKDPCNNQTVSVFTQTITVLGITVDANQSTTPVPINTAITLKATVSPATAGVTVNFYVDNVFKNSAVTDINGLATLNIGSLPSEVYQVKAIVGGGCSESLVYLPVYDPNGGFVTGGGWINSPAGAYVARPTLTGKANFGFVAKYKKGSNQVDGNTEFQFHVGSFNFKSTIHDAGTLVIAGSKATYRGTGTVNGSGNYGFLVTGIDGQVTGGGGYDKFRIKVWDKNNGNAVVYDNDMGLDENGIPSTAIAGGSIVIHNPKKSDGGTGAVNTITFTQAVTLPEKFTVKVLGNPSVNSFRLLLETTNTKDFISIKVVDINGRVVETRQNLTANQTVELGNNLTKGVYFAEVTQGAKKQVVKLTKIAYE
ncbi:MAG: T9SS type A sorting domain-containing protein, partial [Chitinophagaceae bacterium]|nr:T9SS type A sorting domain-containing protein [Chitinophagaceae bacterium]